MRFRQVGSVVIAAVLAVGLLSGCGKTSTASTATTPAATSASGCPTTETSSLAKTKFVLHAGLAAGAFYHWIYQPLQSGSFSSGHSGRIGAIAKAALAAAFVVHELRVARTDAASDPTLCKIVVHPLDTLESAFGSVENKVRGGAVSSADLAPVDQAFTSLKSQASQAGADITNQVPSTLQLLSPSSTGS